VSGPQPRSWAASALGIALMVLAACAALKLAAEWLAQALPVLIPVALVVLVAYVGLQLWQRRRDGW